MEIKQHVQLPNGMTADEDITPQDLLIYVTNLIYSMIKIKMVIMIY